MDEWINKLCMSTWQNITQQWKGTIDTLKNLGESQRHYVEWKKPISKDYILYDSIDLTFSKKQNYSDKKDISGFQD